MLYRGQGERQALMRVFRTALDPGGKAMKLALVIIAAFALAGCARMLWYKEGATQADFRKDTYECEKDARQSGYFGTGFAAQLNMKDFQERCMMARGYEKRRVE